MLEGSTPFEDCKDSCAKLKGPVANEQQAIHSSTKRWPVHIDSSKPSILQSMHEWLSGKANLS